MTDNIDAVAHYHDIREAFTQTGCPFCRLLTQAAGQHIDSLLWEMVNDPDIRYELNQARGYCHQHAWMLVRGGAALGVAILMHDVVKTLLDVLKSHQLDSESASVWTHLLNAFETDQKPATRLIADLSPQTPCPICSGIQTIEEQYINTLLEHMSGPNSLSNVYQNSDGLCLPHFRRALTQAKPAKNLKALIEAQQAVWERLYADLGEFIRKNDYRYRREPFGTEADAWLRALESISGASPSEHKTGLTQSI